VRLCGHSCYVNPADMAKIDPPQIDQMMSDAAWLAHRYDASRDAFHMVHISRTHHRKVPFLTDEGFGKSLRPFEVPRSAAIAHAPSPGPVHFIFHSAFCCSTLLVSAFDAAGMSMGLKEPMLFNDISGWRHRGAQGPQVARVLDESLHLLARPFSPGEAIIIKPSNIANPLIPAIMALRAEARAVFLYAPLPDYLISIARKAMWGRLWVRDLLGKLLAEGMVDLGIDPKDYLGLTDLQVAAVGWLAQQAQFRDLLLRIGARAVGLNSEIFVRNPAHSLETLYQHFQLPDAVNAAKAMVETDVFRRNSKTGDAFSAKDRSDAVRDGRDVHAGEIEKVEHWAKEIAVRCAIPLDLPQTL